MDAWLVTLTLREISFLQLHGEAIDRGEYFSDPNNLATLREGIKLGRQFCSHSEWSKYRGSKVYPFPGVTTNEQIETYIRQTVHTSNALTGTCKMGRGRDAFVESQVRTPPWTWIVDVRSWDQWKPRS